MTFEEIDLVDKAAFEADILAEAALYNEVPTQEALDALFEAHIFQLKRERLHLEVSQLVENNCATLAAISDEIPNYKAWIRDNILENPVVDAAIGFLKAIQAEEVVQANAKVANAYKAKRRAEYPDVYDYIDAQVKKSVPATLVEGSLQEAEYFEKCLAVKVKYPKGNK